MENSTATQNATEAEPLKGGGGGGENGGKAESGGLGQSKCRGGLSFAKLSHWRTAIFFFSLFLCLTIVFAFSFVIPCPVRPQYLATWNRTFSQAGEERPRNYRSRLESRDNTGQLFHRGVCDDCIVSGILVGEV